jgi:hypothetical protein
VVNMQLDASIRIEQIEDGTELVEGPVEVLGGYTLTSNASASAIRDSGWLALAVTPRLESSAHSWRITAVRIHARRTLLSTLVPNAGINVDVRGLLKDDAPSGSILESRLMRVTLLSTLWSWHEVAFASSHHRAPGDGVAIVLRPAAVDNIIEVGSVASGIPDSRASGAASTDGGVNWTVRPSGSPLVQVLGRVTRRVPTTQPQGRLSTLSIVVDAPPGRGGSIRRTFSVPSEPLCPLSVPDKDEVSL